MNQTPAKFQTRVRASVRLNKPPLLEPCPVRQISVPAPTAGQVTHRVIRGPFPCSSGILAVTALQYRRNRASFRIHPAIGTTKDAPALRRTPIPSLRSAGQDGRKAPHPGLKQPHDMGVRAGLLMFFPLRSSCLCGLMALRSGYLEACVPRAVRGFIGSGRKPSNPTRL